MLDRPLYVAIIWNMHQPFYKDLVDNEYALPWVRLHGIKDYYDMAHILEDYPTIHQTFNMVPSLMAQIQDYTSSYIFQIKDNFLTLSIKPPQELTHEERVFILHNFFMVNWEHLIDPYPRYRQLLDKRGRSVSKSELRQTERYFSYQELLDLQVWFNLSWFDPMFKDNDPQLIDLIRRGQNFTEEDKFRVITIQQEVMRLILPEYRRLQDKGQIEVCTSPFYHPILPLLCDHRSARQALPDIQLPQRRFAHPEDARAQIQKTVALYWSIFDRPPRGMWPSEGSVSEDILPLLAEAGFNWLASDEEILAKSLSMPIERDFEQKPTKPSVLYQPYGLPRDGHNLSIVFRDHHISDLIGFVYSRWHSQDAAADLIHRMHRIRQSLINFAGDYLLTVILDGENCWEYYYRDGQDFLRHLYEGLSRDPLIKTVTVSEFLNQHPPKQELRKIFAGSWINHNFRIWIGHPEDNRAWDMLTEARETLVSYARKHPDADPQMLQTAWEEIYIAEGSDWYWWYGDEHSSAHDEIFDSLFRRHLMNVYRILGLNVPDELYLSNLMRNKQVYPVVAPRGFVTPKIDGLVSGYYEWLMAGMLDVSKLGGTMHQMASQIKHLYYGFDANNLYFRVDFSKLPHEMDLSDHTLSLHFIKPGFSKLNIRFLADQKVAAELFLHQNEQWQPKENYIQATLNHILEIKIPLADLGLKENDDLQFLLLLEAHGHELERWPQRGYLSQRIPTQDFEEQMWQV